MPFVDAPGIPGKLWVPDEQPNKEKKHPCPDCFACQWCDDARCEVCLKRKQCTKNSCPEKQ